MCSNQGNQNDEGTESLRVDNVTMCRKDTINHKDLNLTYCIERQKDIRFLSDLFPVVKLHCWIEMYKGIIE